MCSNICARDHRLLGDGNYAVWPTVLLRPPRLAFGAGAVGAATPIQIPLQAAGLVNTFAFALVPAEDRAGHDAVPVVHVLFLM